MSTITHVLTGFVSKAFEQCGYDKRLGVVSVSDRLDLCQFQCNGAFDGAKQYRKSPFVIAGEVVKTLRENTIFEVAEVVKPGFINLTLTNRTILKIAAEIANDANLGIPQVEAPETIVLDYGGPNVAKPLHIGHLRSAIIGESLKRIAKATGRKVISDIHLGDWGLQIGYICENAYKLAATFSSFYHDNHIANESDETKKMTWIALCLLTRKMLLKHLDVLGIDAVESM